MSDFKTALAASNLDWRRKYLGLPGDLIFEQFNQQTRVWTEIGRLKEGWCADEVLSEGAGAANEFNVVMAWREGLDDLVKRAMAIRFGSTRLEKRAGDPGIHSPFLIRLRAQITSGQKSEAKKAR